MNHSPDDERLRRLLEVEQRLQGLVRAAKERAAHRIASTRAGCEGRLAAAREAAEDEDRQLAHAERIVHEEALAAIETAHRLALAAITDVTDARVDELARWAAIQAIGGAGDAG